MSEPIIEIKGLGKTYLIGHKSDTGSYTALRDVVGRTVAGFGRKVMDMAAGRQIIQGDEVELFSALKSLDIEVDQGEVVGIIGRNGAGKSTLLKILSRITEPSEGKVILRGRVASLLEVGTGFHPELSGRENIYLNGAILGMTRNEIKLKFDEIVDFSGVERFLDTPVKRYSSGMYVRLAFSVAAHLEPEILVVDEVLAVGDVEFQKKCLSKMKDVAVGGRTVLFVSHNIAAVQSLCNRGIVLHSGNKVFDGAVEDAVYAYTNKISKNNDRALRGGDGPHIVHASICDDSLRHGDLVVRLEFESPYALEKPFAGLVVKDILGNPVFGHNTMMDETFVSKRGTSGILNFSVTDIPLHAGEYVVSLYFGDRSQNYHIEEDYINFLFVAPPIPMGISTSQIGNMRVKGVWVQS